MKDVSCHGSCYHRYRVVALGRCSRDFDHEGSDAVAVVGTI